MSKEQIKELKEMLVNAALQYIDEFNTASIDNDFTKILEEFLNE